MQKHFASTFVLALVLLAWTVAGCRHYGYGYYERDTYHRHHLDCGHLVECRFHGGRHHYQPHYRHDRYYHLHRSPRGYVKCYVRRGSHRH